MKILQGFAALQHGITEVVIERAFEDCMPAVPVAPVPEGGYGSTASS